MARKGDRVDEPLFVRPIRADGTVIDPAGGGGGDTSVAPRDGNTPTDATFTADTYDAGEELEDQDGEGTVLVFTFSNPMDLIWVRSVGGISRASASGGTPTATNGVYCADDEPTPITLRATILNVFAPVGAVVSVWGCRYA